MRFNVNYANNLLVLVLVATPLVTDEKVHYSFELSQEKRQQLATHFNNQRMDILKLIHGDEPPAEVGPYDCVEKIVAKVSDFFKKPEFKAQFNKTIKELGEKALERSKEVKDVISAKEQKLIAIIKSLNKYITSKYPFNTDIAYQELRIYINDQIDEMGYLQEAVPKLQQVISYLKKDYFREYYETKLRNIKPNEETEHVDLDLVLCELYVPDYDDESEINYRGDCNWKNKEPLLQSIRGNIFSLICSLTDLVDDAQQIYEKGNLYTKWKVGKIINKASKQEKILQALYDEIGDYIDSSLDSELKKNHELDKNKIIDSLPPELDAWYAQLKAELTADGVKIKELASSIAQKINLRNTSLSRDQVKTFLESLRNFVKELDKILNPDDKSPNFKKVYWMLLERELHKKAQESIFLDSHKAVANVIIDKISVGTGEITTNKKFISDQSCEVRLLYFDPKENTISIPSWKFTLRGTSLFIKTEIASDEWQTNFLASEKTVRNKYGGDRELEISHCIFYLLGGDVVWLDFYVRLPHSYKFHAWSRQIKARNVLLI